MPATKHWPNRLHHSPVLSPKPHANTELQARPRLCDCLSMMLKPWPSCMLCRFMPVSRRVTLHCTSRLDGSKHVELLRRCHERNLGCSRVSERFALEHGFPSLGQSPPTQRPGLLDKAEVWGSAPSGDLQSHESPNPYGRCCRNFFQNINEQHLAKESHTSVWELSVVSSCLVTSANLWESFAGARRDRPLWARRL